MRDEVEGPLRKMSNKGDWAKVNLVSPDVSSLDPE